MGLLDRDYMRPNAYLNSARAVSTRAAIASQRMLATATRHDRLRSKTAWVAATVIIFFGLLGAVFSGQRTARTVRASASANPPATVNRPGAETSEYRALQDGTLVELQTSDADLAIQLTAWMPMLAQMSGVVQSQTTQAPIIRTGEVATISLNTDEGLAVHISRGISPYAEVTVNPHLAGLLLEDIVRPWLQLAAYDNSPGSMRPSDRMRLVGLAFQVPQELRTVHAVIDSLAPGRVSVRLEIQAIPGTWTARILDKLQPGPRQFAAPVGGSADVTCAVSLNSAKLLELPPLLADTGLDAYLRQSGTDTLEQLLYHCTAVASGRALTFSGGNINWNSLIQQLGASPQPNGEAAITLAPDVLLEIRGTGIVDRELVPMRGIDASRMRATIRLCKRTNALVLDAVLE